MLEKTVGDGEPVNEIGHFTDEIPRLCLANRKTMLARHVVRHLILFLEGAYSIRVMYPVFQKARGREKLKSGKPNGKVCAEGHNKAGRLSMEFACAASLQNRPLLKFLNRLPATFFQD